jgi:hypothetical protein
MYKLRSIITRLSRTERWKTRLALLTVCIFVHAGCGPRTVDPGPPMPEICPPAEDRVSIQWYEARVEEEREELLRWCAAVGPPVLEAPEVDPTPVTADSLAIVTWNTHVGGGSLGYFIRQLRTGVLTGGRRVDHFVILLQETFRPGSFVTSTGTAPKWSDLMYFSYVTLTTLGYGDFSPLSAGARALAMVEALVGQLFLAVLVARLVGMHIAHSMKK